MEDHPGPPAREVPELTAAHLRIPASVARRYPRQDPEELESVGNLALAAALSRYDPASGGDLGGWLFNAVRSAVFSFLGRRVAAASIDDAGPDGDLPLSHVLGDDSSLPIVLMPSDEEARAAYARLTAREELVLRLRGEEQWTRAACDALLGSGGGAAQSAEVSARVRLSQGRKRPKRTRTVSASSAAPPGRRGWSGEEELRLLEMRERGVTLADCAAALRRPVASVRMKWKLVAPPRLKERKNALSAVASAVLGMHARGESDAAIARANGVSTETVRRFLKKRGLPANGRGGADCRLLDWLRAKRMPRSPLGTFLPVEGP